MCVHLQSKTNLLQWIMTYLNKFHKEVTERKKRKIAASQQLQTSLADFAEYMKHNLALAKAM